MKELKFEAYCDIVKHTEPKGLWIVEGYAATSDLDSQNDIIAQSALDMGARSLREYNTVLLNHDSDRPIGKVLETKSVEGHLFVKIAISRTEPDIWEKVKDGTLDKFSIRGRVTDSEIVPDPLTQKDIFLIKGMELYEVSLVSVPANVHAKALSWYIEKAIRDDVDKSERKPGESLAECVRRKVKINLDEGMPQDQAVAAAYSMCKNNDEEYKGFIMKFVEALKDFMKAEKDSTEKGGEKILEKTEVKAEETKETTTEVEKSEETPTQEVKKEETTVTLDVGALRDVISQLQTIAKDVTTQSETVKKSLEDVAKAKEDITNAKNDMVKMIADLNSVMKEIPIRKAQPAEEQKKEERQGDEFETLVKSDSYAKATPGDKLFTLFKKLEEKSN